MSRLIDADLLELDTEWNEYEDGFMSYSKMQIDNAETIKAIPLEKLEQIREEIKSAYCEVENDYDHGRNYGLYMAEQFIDKALKEQNE